MHMNLHFFIFRALSKSDPVFIKRTLTSTQVRRQNDPIQKLFLDKIREYKSKSSGGKLVEPTPEIERELKNEMEKLEKQYGGEVGADMTAFPTFKFDPPKLDPIDEQAPVKK